MSSHYPQQPAGYNPPSAPPPPAFDGPPPQGPPGMPPPGPPPGPPGMPPPGPHGPQTPPPKKKKTGLIVGLIGGGLVLVLGLCVGGGYLGWRNFIYEEPYEPSFSGGYSLTSAPCADFELSAYTEIVGDGPYNTTADDESDGFTEQSEGHPARALCNYSAAQGDTWASFYAVTAEVYTNASWPERDFEERIDNITESIELGEGRTGDWVIEPFDGVGEEAYLEIGGTHDISSIELHLRDDNMLLSLNFSPDYDFTLEECQQLLGDSAEEVLEVLSK